MDIPSVLPGIIFTIVSVAVGIAMFVGVIVTIVKVVKGTGSVQRKPDFMDRRNEIKPSANSGYDGETKRLCKVLEADKLFEIASGLSDEDGFKSDYGKWLAYMNAAADKGYAPAVRELGLDSKYGDPLKCVKYLERAIEAGDEKAAVELAEIYRRGYCGKDSVLIERDVDKAMKIVLPFAQNGGVEAQAALAKIYQYEVDDDDTALEWYLKAAK